MPIPRSSSCPATATPPRLETTIWRFESNGWPRERLHAIDPPYPMARDDDASPSRGTARWRKHGLPPRRSRPRAAADRRAPGDAWWATRAAAIHPQLHPERRRCGQGEPRHPGRHAQPRRVERARARTRQRVRRQRPLPAGAERAEERARRRGHGTGEVAHAPLRQQRQVRPAAGPWLGDPKLATGVTHEGPALRGATNLVLPRADHRETSFSPAAFEATWRFITGRAPKTLEIVPEERVVLSGKVTGMGVSSTDPASGNLANNLPVPGAHLDIFAIDPATGARRGAPVLSQVIGADGQWGRWSRSTTPATSSWSAPLATRRRTSTAARSRVPAAS